MPFAIVQLTDPHIGAAWSDDPTAAFGNAIAAVDRLLGAAPDAVIVSGDIANSGADSEYEQARSLLERLGAPLYAVAGNHDDRDALRRHFDLPESGTEGDQLYYAADLGPVRLIGLDTKRPDSDGGRLDPAQLTWLDRVLSEDETTPTLVAMHHLPLITGIPAMDAIGIPTDERVAIADIIARHRQVHMIVAGHVHRAIVGQLGGAPVLAIPSTDVQLALDLAPNDMRFAREPPCFALHLLVGGRLVSHIQPVDAISSAATR